MDLQSPRGLYRYVIESTFPVTTATLFGPNMIPRRSENTVGNTGGFFKKNNRVVLMERLMEVWVEIEMKRTFRNK